jgi:Phage tail tube protein
MATKNGNDIGLYVEGVLIGCLTSSEFNSTNEEIDVTCKDDGGARKVLPGGNTASLPFTGFFNPASTYGFKELVSVHKNKTRVWVKHQCDDITITGYAYLNSLNWTAPLNAGSEFNGTFTVDGEWGYSIT